MVRLPSRAWRDALIALLLAVAIGAAQVWRGWADLSALRLPDSDDMMRLQQIRDWLGGQRFGDVAQYRLGLSGVAMHWSRLDDLIPAAIIRELAPLAGRHWAEVCAVIAWPTILLAAAIWLIGQIAETVGGNEAGWRAMILALAAHPASSLFVPGRIDHHNLQMVMILVVALVLVQPATFRCGIAAGIAAGLSFVVGMETAPLLAAATGLIVIEWIWRGNESQRRRLLGFGLGLGGATAAGALFFSTGDWGMPACDGFTALVARAAGTIAALTTVIGMTRSSSARWRALIATMGGSVLLYTMIVTAPQCLSPYGNVDPLLRHLWLSRVGEAIPLAAASPVLSISYAGLMIAGIVAGAWLTLRTRSRGWGTLLALQLFALAVTFVQIRGAYPGALLALPALASVIAIATRHGRVALAASWIAATGIFYPLAAAALPAPPAPAKTAGGDCASTALMAALNTAPVGLVMAPIDTGGPAIATTHHRLVAGAYHRNNPGNLAMYRFYLGTPGHALSEARRLKLDYVIACDGLGIRPPSTSLGAMLAGGRNPDWLKPISRSPDGATLYRVRPASGPPAR
ncbi:hypothetical protein ACM61V_15160 [Sphingomonas sp. TX0543]|uniref:hypothetical protein n=1 Tax=unclassified Sphingomonas TaxID=196159 RepID=UPI0010F70F2E|nr:hypothetical protein [Sphingomonas sp. 3P27F8]